MTTPALTLALEPIALRREQAAAVLSMSVDHFDGHVRPHLRVIRSGRVTPYPREELERWARQNAAMALEDR